MADLTASSSASSFPPATPKALSLARISDLLLSSSLISHLSALTISYIPGSTSPSLTSHLTYLFECCRSSPSLNEELIVDGLHSKLKRLLSLVPADTDSDTDSPADNTPTVLSALYSFAGAQPCFPRPPLTISDDERTLLRPFTSCGVLLQPLWGKMRGQEDVGYLLWPASVVLAGMLEDVRGEVLELGSGLGLVGLKAGMNEGCNVTLSDYNKRVVKNLEHLIDVNEAGGCVASVIDYYGAVGEDGGRFDWVLAADIVCKDEDAVEAAKYLEGCLKSGGRGRVVSATGNYRYGVDLFAGECRGRALRVETRVVSNVVGDDVRRCQGWVEGMDFWVHEIFKE